jgi:hypothetical protein
MQSGSLPQITYTDSELRRLVVTTLDQEPDATFQRVHAHLRAMLGRPLEDSETEGLQQAYQAELAEPTGAHRIGAAEAASLEAHQPFALRWTEKVGVVVGLLPLVFHLQTVTPSTTTKAGAVVAGGVYDFVAMMGGFIAVILSIVAVRQAMMNRSQRPLHFALAAVILLLGIYQSLLGLGLLHRIGLFTAS